MARFLTKPKRLWCRAELSAGGRRVLSLRVPIGTMRVVGWREKGTTVDVRVSRGRAERLGVWVLLSLSRLVAWLCGGSVEVTIS